MRHRKHTFKIGRTGAHRRALLANMVCSLIQEGEIKTTITKAKEARRYADKAVTLGKKGDLHHRRLAIAKLRDTAAVRILFDDIAPRYAERPGGYTRIIRLGARRGDAAEMCLLQWVEETMPEAKVRESVTAAEKPAPKAEEAVEAETAGKATETVEEETTAEADNPEAGQEIVEESVGEIETEEKPAAK